MPYIEKFFRIANKSFDYFIEMPIIMKIMIIAIILVLDIPLAYFLNIHTFSSVRYASQVFNAWLFGDNLLLFLHIAASIPAIALGPFLFSSRLRKEHPNIHKTIGKLYVIGCLIGAITVFPLAMNNPIGLTPRVGFGFMATIWFIVTFFAYTAAINKDFIAHRRWMIRSYAMTFAFIHVNVTYKLLFPFGISSPVTAKVMQSMVSWQFNLLIAELYIEATTFKGRWKHIKPFFNCSVRFSKEDRFYFVKTK